MKYLKSDRVAELLFVGGIGEQNPSFARVEAKTMTYLLMYLLSSCVGVDMHDCVLSKWDVYAVFDRPSFACEGVQELKKVTGEHLEDYALYAFDPTNKNFIPAKCKGEKLVEISEKPAPKPIGSKHDGYILGEDCDLNDNKCFEKILKEHDDYIAKLPLPKPVTTRFVAVKIGRPIAPPGDPRPDCVDINGRQYCFDLDEVIELGLQDDGRGHKSVTWR